MFDPAKFLVFGRDLVQSICQSLSVVPTDAEKADMLFGLQIPLDYWADQKNREPAALRN